jgi:hypothetical protein
MAKYEQQIPVVVELAPLPREQVGPFLLLGVEKTAEREQIEASWAKRLIWARKNTIKTPLEDINWAREAVTDFDKRVKADAASLNLDTTDGVLRRLRERYGSQAAGAAGGQPLDVELSLADFSPAIPVPALDEERRAIPMGEVPREIPAVQKLVDNLVHESIDPWQLELE